MANLAERSPGFFEASGGYKSSLAPTYTDQTANGLAKCIIDWIILHGGDAQRVNTTGMMRRIKGEMKWTKSGSRRGSADIHAIMNGRALSIEVKVGKDRMSKFQKEEQARIERAGGLYYVATSMPDFIKWFNHNLKNK